MKTLAEEHKAVKDTHEQTVKEKDTKIAEMAQEREKISKGEITVINGKIGCGWACNQKHPDANCLVCDRNWNGYHHNGHTCNNGSNAGKRGSFPL